MMRLIFMPNSLHARLAAALTVAALVGAMAASLPDWRSSAGAVSALAALLFFGGAVWLSRWAAGQLLAPLSALGQSARAIHPDVDVMVPLAKPETVELANLVDVFNALIQGLKNLTASLESSVLARTQALAHSETRLNQVLEASAGGFWDWNLTDNQVLINARCCELLGLSTSEHTLPSEIFLNFIDASERATLRAMVCANLKRDSPCRDELQLCQADGSTLWVQLHSSVVERNGNRRATRVVGSITDVSERHLAQTTLQDQTRELNTILDLSPDGFVALDPARSVRYISPAFTRITGIQMEPLLGLQEPEFWACLNQHCEPGTHPITVASVPEIPDSEQPRVRLLVSLSQPQRRMLDVTRRASQSSLVADMLCFRDVTHETEVERLKSEFLATAAHELRTPLSSIYGFAEILLNQTLDVQSNREFLEIIYRQSHVMSLLLNELLDLSRIEARRTKDFDPTEVSAQVLVETVVTGFNLPPGREAPELQTPASDLWMHVDRSKTRQAILNVLANAYKYSPNGGPVVITMHHACAADGSPQVAICITDQGIGMTAQQSSRMFERFYRANRSSKIPGTG